MQLATRDPMPSPNPTAAPPPPTAVPADDAARLAGRLREAMRGDVRFDTAHRALYSTDASNWRLPPVGVVLPRDAADVEAAVAVCRDEGAAVLARGAGTSLAGQATNRAVVLDLSRHMTRVLEVDPDRRLARVEPGCVLDDLRARATPHGLTFGPDPATHAHCTLGGMLGNNACGVHSVMAGRTSDNVRSLDVLTYDGLRLTVGATSPEERAAIVRRGGRRGEIYRRLGELVERWGDLVRERYPRIPRRVSGYNLDELLPENGFHVARALVGSEGTCATILEATLELVPWPAARVLVVAAFDDAFVAADHVPAVLAHRPIGLEGMDRRLVEDQRKKAVVPGDPDLLPEAGDGWLLIEMGADEPEEATAAAERLLAEVRRLPGFAAARIYRTAAEQQAMWEVRETALGTTARVYAEADTWPGWEDSAVPPERLGGYLRELRSLLDRWGYDGALYGHYGDGCAHIRITFDLASATGVERYRAFLDEAAALCVAHGGSLTGEHGDGQARSELLPAMVGEELVEAFREFKSIWDPRGRMNPGRIADPYPIVADLRLGADYAPREPETRFRYPRDRGSFARAALRCVGVGRCRRDHGGTMCPSFQVTREEAHSTRGRARLLFEMLRGEVIRDGWQSEEVKEALDLCLSCKGCKHDCPVGVDMATYKAEFLSHYYEEHHRPLAAWLFGHVDRWARLGARWPGAAGAATALADLPVVGRALRRAVGIAPERPLPRLARRPFRRRFAELATGPADGRPVLLFPDTFAEYFQPEVAVAAVEVLARSGFRVEIPPRPFCCGRPLYDYGFVDRARRRLEEAMEILDPWLDAAPPEAPIVGLEPSCIVTFRDELLELFPDDERAHRIAGRFRTLAELLAEAEPAGDPPRLAGRALFHGHCHHESILGTAADRALLERLGLEVEAPDTGCCGMAGAFGYEAGERYRVSLAAGERVLLPAVRRADPDTLVVTDGFSCREQVRQTTGRRAHHLAEVLARAHGIAPGDEAPARRVRRRRGALVAGAVGALAIAALVFGRRRRPDRRRCR